MRPDHLRMPPLLTALIIALAGLTAAASAWGHGLSVFAWAEGGRVFVESKFSGGKRPVDATVRVLDPDGRELLTGKTDDQGRWAFDPPQKTALKIVLEAGLGHRAEWTLRAEEVGAPPHGAGAAAPPPQAPAPSPAADGSTDPVDARLQKIVLEALQPIDARLARLEAARQGPRLQEILGGLGYILGLVGVGAYVQARRIRNEAAAKGRAP